MRVTCPRCTRQALIEAHVTVMTEDGNGKKRIVTVDPHSTAEGTIAQCLCGQYLTDKDGR